MPTVNKVKRPWIKSSPKPDNSRWNDKPAGDIPENFYRQAAWRTVRALKLQQNPLCEECKQKNRLVEAKVVDHIQPIRLGGEPLDMANLRSLCTSCHNRKSGKERHIKK